MSEKDLSSWKRPLFSSIIAKFPWNQLGLFSLQKKNSIHQFIELTILGFAFARYPLALIQLQSAGLH